MWCSKGYTAAKNRFNVNYLINQLTYRFNTLIYAALYVVSQSLGTQEELSTPNGSQDLVKYETMMFERARGC